MIVYKSYFAVLMGTLISGAMAMQNQQTLIQNLPQPQQVVIIPQHVQVQVQPNVLQPQQMNVIQNNQQLGFSTVGELKKKKLPDQFYFYNFSKEYISDGSINLECIIKALQKKKPNSRYKDLYTAILKEVTKKKGKQEKVTFLTEMAAALRHGLPITKKKYEPCIEVTFYDGQSYRYNKNMLDFSRLLFLTAQTFDPTVANTNSYQQTLAHIDHVRGNNVYDIYQVPSSWASQDHLKYWKL